MRECRVPAQTWRQSARLTLTFFGGETLLNFKVVKATVEYARQRSREAGKPIDFSLTTNATLLTEEIVQFLTENHVGVTISIDGPKELQDRFRTFSNGAGSYDQILPRIRSLLKNHRTRPVGARVTLTSQVMDVIRIFDHLTDDIGFSMKSGSLRSPRRQTRCTPSAMPDSIRCSTNSRNWDNGIWRRRSR